MTKSYEDVNWLAIIIMILVAVVAFLTIFFSGIGDTIIQTACDSGVLVGSTCGA